MKRLRGKSAKCAGIEIFIKESVRRLDALITGGNQYY